MELCVHLKNPVDAEKVIQNLNEKSIEGLQIIGVNNGKT